MCRIGNVSLKIIVIGDYNEMRKSPPTFIETTLFYEHNLLYDRIYKRLKSEISEIYIHLRERIMHSKERKLHESPHSCIDDTTAPRGLKVYSKCRGRAIAVIESWLLKSWLFSLLPDPTQIFLLGRKIW